MNGSVSGGEPHGFLSDQYGISMRLFVAAVLDAMLDWWWMVRLHSSTPDAPKLYKRLCSDIVCIE